MFEYTVIIILSGFLALREILHHKERKDMLDRLMARSFTEFKDNEKPVESNFKTKDDGTAELDDVKDEVYGEKELD